ncbi:SCO family protein [Robertmurraya andreesenii]|uniref:Protein SCO1/2 n=1 Tax=Anoxybacillus andreesenii TaxID=1325932 RepID=A0ABT9V5X3_9BACL|nr:SCO family protein [Robertmurraya andreesenii]MDQ0156240.1 protein SCO1/2 [Robertmurraya andreesenii]
MLILPLLLLSACSTQEQEETQNIDNNGKTVSEDKFVPEYDWALAYIEAVNQNNEKTTLQKFQGKPWIMNMIFTNCTTVCLPMTANMAKLQTKLKEQNLDYHLVSYTVDPENDTPEILKECGAQYEADFSNWDFLTGYSEEDIQRLAKSVKTLAEKPAGTDQVSHSTKFFLIDRNGVAVKGYDGVNPPYDDIIHDLKSID